MVNLVNNMHKGFQARLGMRFLHQLLDQFDSGEHDALAGARDMRKQAMFNGVELGAVGRIMGYADFHADLVGEGLQVSLEQEMPGIVTAAAITLDQDRGGTGEVRLSIVVPPMAQAITHKFAGVVAGADLNVPDILFFVMQTMRDDDTCSTASEVMVIGQQGFQRPPCKYCSRAPSYPY